MELNFNHFTIKTQPGMEDDPVRAGFLMHLTDRRATGGGLRPLEPAVHAQSKPFTTEKIPPNSETTARQSIEAALERLGADRDDCWLDHPGPKDTVIDMSDPATWTMQVGAVA